MDSEARRKEAEAKWTELEAKRKEIAAKRMQRDEQTSVIRERVAADEEN